MLLDQIGGVADDLGVENRVPAGIVECRDRHPPRPLPRDAPVGTGLHGPLDAVHAPVRNPFHPVDFIQRLLTERSRSCQSAVFGSVRTGPRFHNRGCVVDVDEPLVHRAEDDRRFAAPAMGVAVMIILLVEQSVPQSQLVQHGLVGVALAVLFQNQFSNHPGRHLLLHRQIIGVREASVVVHRRINRQPLLAAERVVLDAVPRRDVDEAGPGVARHKIVACIQLSRAVAERVPVVQSRQFIRVERLFRVTAPAAFPGDGGQEAAEQNVIFPANGDLHVLERRVVSHRQVRRQRPGRRRPDQHERVRLADDGKLDSDARADVVFVFDFGLSQRGAAWDAPVHRLLAAVNKSLPDDIGEQPQFVRLVFLVERQVRIVPVAEHAEPFELDALNIDVFEGIGLARLADGGGIKG